MAGMQIRSRHARSLLVLPVILLIGSGVVGLNALQASAPQAQSAKDSVAGIRNFTRVDVTMACGGAISPEAFAALKQAGFASVVNLRVDTEPGVDIEAERKASKEAGLKYFHLPFSAASPETAKFDEFLKLVTARENQPMLVACASGGRASVFLFVKRVLVDGWPVDKAMTELPDRFNTVSPSIRDLALAYIKANGKDRP